jgi:hypothetical protein
MPSDASRSLRSLSLLFALVAPPRERCMLGADVRCDLGHLHARPHGRKPAGS